MSNQSEAWKESLEGWKEALIALRVCASLHREYAKGKDPFFKTRQDDFERDIKFAQEKYKQLEGKLKGNIK